MQLEKIGLRKSSYPFDWIISDFEGVVCAIDSVFENYNDILWVANKGISSRIIKIHEVLPDYQDVCCRKLLKIMLIYVLCLSIVS